MTGLLGGPKLLASILCESLEDESGDWFRFLLVNTRTNQKNLVVVCTTDAGTDMLLAQLDNLKEEGRTKTLRQDASLVDGDG